MDSIEREIKKVLIKVGTPRDIEAWFSRPCPTLDNKTPKQLVEEGQGQEVLKNAIGLYRDNERVGKSLDHQLVPNGDP